MRERIDTIPVYNQTYWQAIKLVFYELFPDTYAIHKGGIKQFGIYKLKD